MNDLVERDEQRGVATAQQDEQMTGMLQVIERLATNPEADIEKLERMLTLQEKIWDRQAKQVFNTALAALQGELPEVEKLAKGQSSKYAKFETIMAAIKPAMQRHGFSISHRTSVGDGMVVVTAILSHSGGHTETMTLPLPIDTTGNKNSVQGVGSTLEYGRRYTTNSMIGVATRDSDTDGNTPNSGKISCITEDQIKRLYGAMEAAGVTTEQFLKKAQVDRVSDVHPQRFQAALSWLKSVAEGEEI